MSFLYPFYFWAMLGLVPLAAVYFLKVRPRRKPTSAFFLWQKLFDQKRSTSLFQKLRDLLSLFLMLLAFIFVVLALTAPVYNDAQRKDLFIIINNSASMSAADKNGTRLDEAKEIAKDIIRSLNHNQRAAIASMSIDIRYMSHFTTSPRTLIDAAADIKPSDCPFHIQALDMAVMQSQIIQNEPNSEPQGVSGDYRILLISDGCGIDGNLPDSIELFKVGRKSNNVGFTACDMKRIAGTNDQVELYFQIASSADEVIQADLLVQYGPELHVQKLIPVEIKPGFNKSEQYIIANAQPGIWTVQIDYDDALDKDNIAYLAVPPKQTIRVAVDSNDAYFLQNSVLAFSQTSGDLVLTDSQPDIILSKGAPSEQGQSIVFDPEPSEGWWGGFGEQIENVLPRIIVKDHPLLEHCDIEAIPFIGAREVNLPGDSFVLVENSDHVPLIYRVRYGEKNAVVVNMNLKDSEFYYSAWFPVIIYNTARNLMGKSEQFASAYPTGSAISMPDIKDEDKWFVTYELPKESEVADDENKTEINESQFTVRELGYYTFSNSSGQWQTGSGLFNKSQTMINNEVPDTSMPIHRGTSPSVILSVLAMLILAAESILYQRRKAG
ncbi:MAG: BatA and WFA domain-containing protein [Sedimentisphaerales bacterium]|nr:BatA and WFA domain-containing protein [Sedimentisphaerales bacterium]